jgi:prevent-host-death family protein
MELDFNSLVWLDKRLLKVHIKSILNLKREYQMKLSQAIKPISYFKAHAADVIRDLNEQHGTMIITQNGEAKAVIQDINEYERIQEALALLKMVAQGQKDYEEGKTIPAEQVFKELDEMIAKDFV